MRNCTVCGFDLIFVESEREDVDLLYPHPITGQMTPIRLDLCSKHLALAQDPTNIIEVTS